MASWYGAEFIEPLCDAFGSPVERYLQTHEGGTDHDANDAWMAAQLGSTPRPRLWAEAMV